MRIPVSAIKRAMLVTALVTAALLGGCSGGGISLEGPGFEALGLTGSKNKGDKKVPDRAPLLIPPDRARLPQPQQSTASAPPQNWPKDPDSLLKAEASEAEKKQREYEDYGDWSKKADIDEFEKLMDPLERSKGIFGSRNLGKKYRDSNSYPNE
jgi:hypothetical protein